MGAVMQHKFCGVFKHKKQMYVARLANANGPNCMIWPPKPLFRGLSVSGLAEEIEAALRDYTSLGRSIYPEEWKERDDQLLTYFGERSVSAFQKKKKDIGIRYDVARGIYVLGDGNSGTVFAEVTSALDAARAIYERIGEPTTEPPNNPRNPQP